MRFTLSLIFILSTFWSVLGQSACGNIGFENGNFQSWEGTYGCNDKSAGDFEVQYTNCSGLPSGQSFQQPQASQINSLDGQQAIVSATFNGGRDPYIPELFIQSPLGGNYVARLGDYYADGALGSMEYEIDVTEDNALLTIYYAIVLEAPNGGHVDHERPYFRLRLLDPSNNSVSCVEYLQDGTADAEGFETKTCLGGCVSSVDGNRTQESDLQYRLWTAISTNLLPYVGQKVTLEFTGGDCALTGHIGYAYVDAACGVNELTFSSNLFCKGSDHFLSAPVGMDQYEWRLGSTTGPVVGTSKDHVPSTAGTYYCTMVPFSTTTKTCPYTLSITIQEDPSSPTANFNFAPTNPCANVPIAFTDQSSTNDGSAIQSWKWDFGGKGSSSAQNPSYAFTKGGTYNVTLVVTSQGGCVDTIVKQVVVQGLEQPRLFPPGEFCSNDAPVIIKGEPLGGTFSGPGIVNSTTGLFDPSVAITAGVSPFRVKYHYGSCGEFAMLTIPVYKSKIATFDPIGPFCSNDAPVKVDVTETGGKWVGTGINNAGIFNPEQAQIGQNVITYSFDQVCGDTVSQTVVVNEAKDATIEAPGLVCISQDPFFIQKNTDGGTWTGAVSTEGEFDPNIGEGEYEITYRFSGSCPSADTIQILVVGWADASFDIPSEICLNDDPLTIAPLQPGGEWKVDGSPATSVFSPQNAGVGSHEIMYFFDNQCGDTVIKNIEVLPNKIAKITPISSLCPLDDIVKLQVLQSGGTWSGDVSNQGEFDPSIGEGEYWAVYTMSDPCGAIDSLKIEVLPMPDAEFTLPSIVCENGGVITFAPVQTGGKWSGNGVIDSDNGVFNPAIAGVGTHEITYKISGSCNDEVHKNIQVVAAKNASLTAVNPVCQNQTPFAIQAVESGGVWKGNGIDQSGLFDPSIAGVGTHEIVYTLSNPCGDSDTIWVDVLAVPNPFFSNPGNLCAGTDAIQLQATQSGGTWSGVGVMSNGMFDPQLAGEGSHTVTYTIGGACAQSHIDTIKVLHQADASIDGPLVLCPKDDVFQMQFNEAGGVWSGPGVDANGFVDPAVLPTGQVITITYEISGACGDKDQHQITIKSLYNSTILPFDIYCEDQEYDTLKAVDAGGSWSGPGIVNFGKGFFDPKVAGPGKHVIRYTVSGNCGTSSVDTIEVKERKDASIINIDPLCHDASFVTLQTNTPNGVWSGDVTSNGTFDPALVSPGTYKAYYAFSDPFCPSEDSLDLVVTPPIIIDDSVYTPRCFKDCNGLIDLKVTGGWDKSAYQYTWTPSAPNSSVNSNLCPGNYSVQVSDRFGCVANQSFVVNPPDSLYVLADAKTANCGQDDGEAFVDQIVGGTAPFTFQWNNGVQTESNPNLASGTYWLRVRDRNGCLAYDTVEVKDSEGPSFEVQVDSVRCFGESNGAAFVQNILGGVSPYTIAWSTGQSGVQSQHLNLPANEYSVQVSDVNNCLATQIFEVHEPEQLKIAPLEDLLLCDGQDTVLIADAFGGTEDYDFYWDDVEKSGDYTISSPQYVSVYAIDAKGCVSDTANAKIQYRDPLSITAFPKDSLVCIDDEVVARVSGAGGKTPYTFSWENGAVGSEVTLVAEGTYGDTTRIKVTIEDGCSVPQDDFVSFYFHEPAKPSFQATPVNGCEPLRVDFTNTSQLATSVQWETGDGTSYGNVNEFSHVYSAGIYHPKMVAISEKGCETELVMDSLIHSYRTPEVDFTWQPGNITTTHDQIQFVDFTRGDVAIWQWAFYKGDTHLFDSSNEHAPIIQSPKEAGEYEAYVRVESPFGCADSLWKTFVIEEDYLVYVPNSFTPNGDGVNDVFKPVLTGAIPTHFEFLIFNRWGELIWETQDLEQGWNGFLQKQGTEAPSALYSWKLVVRDFKGINHEYFGHVMLVR